MERFSAESDPRFARRRSRRSAERADALRTARLRNDGRPVLDRARDRNDVSEELAPAALRLDSTEWRQPLRDPDHGAEPEQSARRLHRAVEVDDAEIDVGRPSPAF